MKRVKVGDDTWMFPPDANIEWALRYTDAGHRMEAAEMLASYRFLVHSCSRDEGWRRIKLMREAVKALADGS
jgi:hypothetical protein